MTARAEEAACPARPTPPRPVPPRASVRPDADDHDILREAFFVAGLNQRLAVLDALLDRGFPVDAAPWGSTLLQWAEGNRVTGLAEYLVKRGARP